MKKIALIIFALIIYSCKDTNFKLTPPPNFSGLTVEEKIFDKKIVDEFRNLENLKDTVVSNWFKEQSDYSNNYLNKISNRTELALKMQDIDNRKKFFVKKTNVTDNNQYFYLKRKSDEDQYKLYYNKNIEGSNEKLLFDAKDYKPETQNNYKINYIKPSWDAKYIVVSLSHSGKELSELLIIDVETQQPLPQVLSNAWPSAYLGINWLPDSSGFIFLYFPIKDSKHTEFKNNTKSVLYKIGDEPSNLKTLFSSKTQNQFDIKQNEFPIIKIKSSNDKYLIGYVATVGNYWDAYYVETKNIEKKVIPWKPLYKKEDKIITSKGLLNGDEFIYKSGLNVSNFAILSTSMLNLNFKKPKILAAEKNDEVITHFEITSNGLFYTAYKNGIEANLYYAKDGVSKKIKLPKKSGKINIDSKGNQFSDLWVETSGWLNGVERYKFDIKEDKFIDADITEPVKYDEYSDFVIEEILVKSHDNEEVPLSIIYDKNIKKNGENPAFFYGYGAYGDAVKPFFSPVFLTWVQNGGVLCIAHVRGGNEKGDKWRNGGFKATKPNTWKDLIACTQYMINNKFTSKDRTVVYASSAGGVMAGGAIAERPDLFAASIIDAGVLNPLRRHVYSGGSSYREYGDINDSIEAMGLIKMDAYHNLDKNKKYPSTLLGTGFNDARVAPWMSGKFIAKLQANNSTNNPMLLNVDFQGGHDANSSVKKIYQDWANKFAFALWQTGHPNYQLEGI